MRTTENACDLFVCPRTVGIVIQCLTCAGRDLTLINGKRRVFSDILTPRELRCRKKGTFASGIFATALANASTVGTWSLTAQEVAYCDQSGF
jgi:hypothetical protein